MAPDGLTVRQQKYRAALVANLETHTGRPLKEWLGVARSCPESAPRARLRWFKHTHGLGQNYAMYVLGELDREQGRTAPARSRRPGRSAGRCGWGSRWPRRPARA